MLKPKCFKFSVSLVQMKKQIPTENLLDYQNRRACIIKNFPNGTKLRYLIHNTTYIVMINDKNFAEDFEELKLDQACRGSRSRSKYGRFPTASRTYSCLFLAPAYFTTAYADLQKIRSCQNNKLTAPLSRSLLQILRLNDFGDRGAKANCVSH